MKGWGPWVVAENFRQVRQGFEPLEVCLKFDTLKLGIDTKAGMDRLQRVGDAQESSGDSHRDCEAEDYETEELMEESHDSMGKGYTSEGLTMLKAWGQVNEKQSVDKVVYREKHLRCATQQVEVVAEDAVELGRRLAVKLGLERVAEVVVALG